jgi:fused signal recognition particle receptor
MKSLADRLKLTRSNLFGTLFNKNKSDLNDSIFNELEDRFLLADIGVKTTAQIIQLLKSAFKKDLADFPLDEQIKKILISILKPVENNFAIPDDINKPYLILVVGVNGVGKTTTIGKLTKFIKSKGKSVLLAAADTFRAAATEQLKKWGELNNVEIISLPNGSDSGAVIYNALQSAQANNIDVLIADTAGRLHNKKNLMDEIKKINNVSAKFDTSIKKETFLILDAGTGQNTLVQAKEFQETIGIDGIILTKLDGTAKGGIVFALANELNIPIHFIGVGEQIDDLQLFDASKFVDSLLGKN